MGEGWQASPGREQIAVCQKVGSAEEEGEGGEGGGAGEEGGEHRPAPPARLPQLQCLQVSQRGPGAAVDQSGRQGEADQGGAAASHLPHLQRGGTTVLWCPVNIRLQINLIRTSGA